MPQHKGPADRFDVTHGTLSITTGPQSIQLITAQVSRWLNDIGAHSGTLLVFCMHTSASLTLQENADPTVQDDILDYLEDLVPKGRPYAHDYEGPDDMPAHIKTMLTSTSLTLPVQNGDLVRGTWQGIYLMEHRARSHRRSIHLTFTGMRHD